MDEKQILFSLIRAELGGAVIDTALTDSITADMLEELYSLSDKHDLSHIVGSALSKINLQIEGDILQKFQKDTFSAVYRYQKLNYELSAVTKTLEGAQIPFMPLKGSVLRKYYPKPWLRTSCDVDVLVREEDLDRAVRVLVNSLKYRSEGKGSHDISLFSQSGMHIELHYKLVEDGLADSITKLLSLAWDMAVLKEGSSYHYEMPDGMFYFYHVAHMSKHFENGGCGIRPFIDLWILDNIDCADNEKREELLRCGGLLQFAEVSRKLSRVWLDGEEYDSLTEKMQSYILFGGVYGNAENRIVVQQQKKGGKIKYALSKIFIPLETIKLQYPILEKHPYLMPIMQVRRWFKLIFCGHAKRSIRELSYSNNISKAKSEEIKNFLLEIGL